ncbi:hypothetical protein ACFPRL_01970 [Pseudoclavibacter helvolus]
MTVHSSEAQASRSMSSAPSLGSDSTSVPSREPQPSILGRGLFTQATSESVHLKGIPWIFSSSSCRSCWPSPASC